MISLDGWLNAFATFFVTIDPPGMAAIFLGLTAGLSSAERAQVAWRGTATGMSIILVFTLVGGSLLSLLGITMPAFRVAGGLLLFSIAFEMVFEKRAERRNETVEKIMTRAELHSIAVFPLAIPLIAGPGAISAGILLASEADDTLALLEPLSALLAVGVILYLALRLANRADALLGDTGRVILTRLLGILLAALAVQFIADGAKKLFI